MKGLISAQIVQDRNYAASNKGKDKGEQQHFFSTPLYKQNSQCPKKVLSDSPGLCGILP